MHVQNHSHTTENDRKIEITVIGGGPSGMMAAVTAAHHGASVTIYEKLPDLGRKLLASGGGRCNLTNTLPSEEFMARFGRFGRHMEPALSLFGAAELRAFLEACGVATHAPDGFHVFPVSHRAGDVLQALVCELRNEKVCVRTGVRVLKVTHDAGRFFIRTSAGASGADAVILATGGQGYPVLGGGVDGYDVAQSFGHTVTSRYPGMVHLLTQEAWPGRCRADTIPKAFIEIQIGRKKRQLYGPGDLIFTQRGLAGPLVLDTSRYITPALAAGSITAWLRLTEHTHGEWMEKLTATAEHKGETALLAALQEGGLPASVARVLCEHADTPPERPLAEVPKQNRNTVAEWAARLPVVLIGSAGFEEAMVTRGGVSLREVAPDTLESRLVENLYICGELLDLDGPCGGFNLQWAFSSGFLAGRSVATGKR